jgi:hypothetical protein
MRYKQKLDTFVEAVPTVYAVTYSDGRKVLMSAQKFENYFEEERPSEPATEPLKHQLFYIVVVVLNCLNGHTEVVRATNPAVEDVFYSRELAQAAADSEHATNGLNYQVVEVDV